MLGAWFSVSLTRCATSQTNRRNWLRSHAFQAFVSYRKPKEWRQYGLKQLVLEHRLNVYTDAKDEAEMHTAYVYAVQNRDQGPSVIELFVHSPSPALAARVSLWDADLHKTSNCSFAILFTALKPTVDLPKSATHTGKAVLVR